MDSIKLWPQLRSFDFRSYPKDKINVTGTLDGSKFGMDVNLIGSTNPIDSNVVVDLSDKISAFKLYDVDHFETIDPVTYVMYSDLSGKWFVKRVDEGAGTVRYASIVNNLSETFGTAWGNRATLNYTYRKDIVSGL